ncbi:MAG TPA: ABC transporter ATP-binding protein [Clostridiales bacterium]|nr:ABC transporter ATP-binding protein [Clostridiales bacterium]
MLYIEDLVKRYGKFTAVDHLNLEIKKGEIFGFIGPNGAGKTTTMRIIATLLQPTQGTVLVDGVDVIKSPVKVRGKIGYMPDFFGVYDNLKVGEYLDFYGDSYEIQKTEREKMSKNLLELVNLNGLEDKYVDTLSRGMKQRLCLARSLIHNPDLLVLDEPASGMDPRARLEMMGILKELKKLGKTIIISSHILHELTELCDVVGVIENGKLVAHGNVDDIMARVMGRKVITIKLLNSIDRAIKILKQQPAVKGIVEEGNTVEVSYDCEDEELWIIIKSLVDESIPVVSFTKGENNLEKVFMEVTYGYEAK